MDGDEVEIGDCKCWGAGGRKKQSRKQIPELQKAGAFVFVLISCFDIKGGWKIVREGSAGSCELHVAMLLRLRPCR